MRPSLLPRARSTRTDRAWRKRLQFPHGKALRDLRYAVLLQAIARRSSEVVLEALPRNLQRRARQANGWRLPEGIDPLEQDERKGNAPVPGERVPPGYSPGERSPGRVGEIAQREGRQSARAR